MLVRQTDRHRFILLRLFGWVRTQALFEMGSFAVYVAGGAGNVLCEARTASLLVEIDYRLRKRDRRLLKWVRARQTLEAFNIRDVASFTLLASREKGKEEFERAFRGVTFLRWDKLLLSNVVDRRLTGPVQRSGIFGRQIVKSSLVRRIAKHGEYSRPK